MKKFFQKFKKKSSQGLYELTIVETRKPTSDSKLIRFSIPENVQSVFQWQAGQYITLHIEFEGKTNNRDYSICNLSGAPYLEICVKKTANGFISKYLVDENWDGKTLQVSAPKGRFVLPVKPNEKRTLVAFAAGSGITPIYSIIQDVLQNEKDAQFYLFYGNKTPESTIFKQEIEDLQKTHSEKFNPYFIYSESETDNPLWNGRIDEKKLDLWINQILDWDEVDEVLICGPNELAVGLRDACIERGLHASQIHLELFTPIAPPSISSANSNQSAVTIKSKYLGQTSEIIWENFSESMLDTMLNQGVDVPYSCKGGVCGTCMCKLTGDAKMGEQLVLLDSEIANGKFLPCVSYQANGDISLDFDV